MSVTKGIRSEDIKKVRNPGHTKISYILNTLGILIMVYIGTKYINSPDAISVAFAEYSFLLCGFGIAGFFTIDYFDNRKINIYPEKFPKFDPVRFLVAVTVLFMPALFIDYFLKITMRYALTDIDLVLYYLFAGVCEEAFFRGCVLNGIIGIATKKGKKPHFMVIIVALIVSSVAFMAVHLEVYGSDPTMLLSTLLGGFLLGGGYLIFRDMGANMSAHTLKNVVGYINLVRFA